jgi:hypothetical protein
MVGEYPAAKRVHAGETTGSEIGEGVDREAHGAPGLHVERFKR